MPSLTEPRTPVNEPLVVKQSINLLCNRDNDNCQGPNHRADVGRDFLVHRRQRLNRVSKPDSGVPLMESQEAHEFQRIQLRHIEQGSESDEQQLTFEEFAKLSRREREAFLMKHRHLLRHVEGEQQQQQQEQQQEQQQQEQQEQEEQEQQQQEQQERRPRQQDVIVHLQPAPVKSILKSSKRSVDNKMEQQKDNSNIKTERKERLEKDRKKVVEMEKESSLSEKSLSSKARRRSKSSGLESKRRLRTSSSNTTRPKIAGGFQAPTQAWLWHVGRNKREVKKERAMRSGKRQEASRANVMHDGDHNDKANDQHGDKGRATEKSGRRSASATPTPTPTPAPKPTPTPAPKPTPTPTPTTKPTPTPAPKPTPTPTPSRSGRKSSNESERTRKRSQSALDTAKKPPMGSKSESKVSSTRKSSLQSKLNRRLQMIEDSSSVASSNETSTTSTSTRVVSLNSSRDRRASLRNETTNEKKTTSSEVQEIPIPSSGMAAERTTMVVRVHPGHSRRLSNCSSVSKEETTTFTADVLEGEEQEVRAGLEITFESLPQTIDIRLIPDNGGDDANSNVGSRKTSNVSHVDVGNEQEEGDDKTRQ